MKELSVVLDTFSGLMAKLRRAFIGVALDGRTKEQRLILLAYASLFEKVYASIALLRSGGYSSLPLVLRPALESYADIVNIANDKTYALRVLHDLDKKQFKYMRDICALGRNDINLEQEMVEIKSAIEEYPQECRKHILKKEKFSMAGIETYYTVVYGMMSGHAHNDYNFTICHDVDVKADFLESFAGSARVKQILPAFLALMCESLSRCTKAVVDSVGEYNPELIESFFRDIEELQQHIMSAYPRRGDPS